mmetsp:Transcript_28161/g.57730  ORF Transcript_28161/g.57730 Transcript_28161/m.57730 type:complete len:184 (+) Transcript_28161:68-619(+)
MDIFGLILGSAGDSDTVEDNGEVSSDSSGDENEDDALRTFKSVLKRGLNIVQYGTIGPACTIHLVLKRDVLYWTGGRALANGKRELSLLDVHFVDVGKNTAAFSSASAAGIADEICFSLVTADDTAAVDMAAGVLSLLSFGNSPVSAGQTLDLQASSAVERDALTQGISMAMAALAAAEEPAT